MKNSNKILLSTLVAAAAATFAASAFAEDLELNLEGGTNTYTTTTTYGHIYLTNGTVNIGSADATGTVITTGAFVGTYENAGGPTTLNIVSGSTLTITGTGTSINSGEASLMLANWPAAGAVNVSGTLNVSSGLSSRDGSGTFTVNDGGVVNFVNGLTTASRDAARMVINISSGSRVNIGSGGIAATSGDMTLNLNGGTLGVLGSDSNASWSTSRALTFGTNAVTIDTTVHKMADDGNSSSAITGTGGTITLSGTLSGLTGTNLVLSGPGTVNLSGATFALTGDTLEGTHQLFTTDTSSSPTVTTNFSASNFTWNGSALSGRTTVTYNSGSVTFSGIAASLVWNGSTSGTWDTTTENWTNAGTSEHFYTGDNVTFNTADASVALSGGITAGTITIAANTTLTSTNVSSNYVLASSGTTIGGGDSAATLTLSSGGQTSALRGTVTIKNNGTLSLTTNDAAGWGSSNNISALRIEEGGTLNITTDATGDNGNQTFNMSGGITLQGGTISGVENAKFDLFNSSTGITTLASATTATISTAIGLRSNGTFTVADGTTADGVDLLVSGRLTSKSGITDGKETFSTTLTKAGAGTMKLTGDNSNWTSGGTISAGKLIAASTNALGTGNLSVASGATLEIAVGAGETLTYAGNLTSNNSAGTLDITSGTLQLTSASNNFRGTVNIYDGGVLDFGTTGKLVSGYSNGSRIYVKTGGELKLNSFAYGAAGSFGAQPDYATHRVLDGGKISVGGATEESGQGFTVNSTGGTFEVTASEKTLTLKGNGNSNTIVLGGALKIGGAGNIIINKNASQVAIAGEGSLTKIGSGTLTINAAGNTYSGGTTVTEGTLVVGASDALGTSGDVTVAAGAQIKASAAVTLTGVLKLFVGGENNSTALITSDGTNAFTLGSNTTVYIDISALASTTDDTGTAAETLALNIATENALKKADDTVSFKIGSWTGDDTWTDSEAYANATFDPTTGTITPAAIPEPSAFGLLAGIGALAFAISRRRRRAC